MRIPRSVFRAILLLGAGAIFGASAQTMDYSIRAIGTSTAYAGHDVYYDVVPVVTSGTAAKWYVNSVQLGGEPATFALICRDVPCPVDSVGRPWDNANAGSIVLKVSVPSGLVPGQRQITMQTDSAGVIRTTTIPLQILPPPTPLPSSPYLPATPPIPGRAKWESTMTTLGRNWCNPSQVMDFNSEALVWYYDGARVFFQIADYTGDRSYEACAYNIARQYRDYVFSSNGRVPGWRLFSTGLRMAYERSGDTTYRDAVRLLATKSGFMTWALGVTESSIREIAYLTNALVDAERIGEPRSPVLARNIDYLLGHFDRLFVARTADLHQTFFDGLGAEALINAYDVTHDPRIPPAIKTMLDWEWDYGWNKSTFQLVYNPEPYGPKCTDMCQDYLTNLINLVVPSYAWYWSMTGDTTAQQRGDEMFSHALDSDISFSGKIFSQNYHWSPLYVFWRSKTGTQPSFSLTATPTDRSVAAGGSVTFPLSLTGENGFNGSASLTVANVPAAITASISPAVVPLGSTATSATVNVTVAGTVAPGTYPLQVSATAAGVTRSVNLNLTVADAPTFTVAQSGAVSITAGNSKDISLAISPANNFTGSVQLSASGAPAGISCVFLSNPVSVTGTTASVLRITIPATAAAGTWNLHVTTVSGTITREIDIPVTVSTAPSFTLTTASSSQSVQPGASTNFTVSAGAQDGFSGTVALSVSGVPAGVTITPATSSLTLAGTTPVSTALTAAVGTAVAPGSYPFTVTASGNGVARNVNLSLTVVPVGSFNLASTSTIITMTAGTTQSVGVILTAANSFSGNVQLAASGLPSGIAASFQTTTLAVAPTAPAQSALVLSPAADVVPGTYHVRISATSGTIVRAVDLTVTVMAAAASGATVTTEAPALTVKSGSHTSTGVSITPPPGFKGLIYVYADQSIPGGSYSFSHRMFTVNQGNANNTRTSTLTVKAGTAAPGNYSFSIVVWIGSQLQRIPMTVTVTP